MYRVVNSIYKCYWEEICRISTNTLDGKNASTNTNTSKTSGLEPVFEANEVNEVETLHEDEDHFISSISSPI